MENALMRTPVEIKNKVTEILVRETDLKPTKFIASLTNNFKNLKNVDLRHIDLSNIPIPFWFIIIQEWTKIENLYLTFFPQLDLFAKYLSEFCFNFKILSVQVLNAQRAEAEIELAKIFQKSRFKLETCRSFGRKFLSKKFQGKTWGVLF